MATFVPPKRAVAFTFYVGLVGRSTRPQLQVNPTLAAGDVQVSKDGGAFANLTTLPVVTPASGRAVKVDLSATEMTADQVVVQFVDAAGAEWDDLFVNIQTAARQIDDLAFPNVSGRGIDVSAAGEVDADLKLWLAAAPDALSSGKVPADLKLWLTVAPSALISGRVDANAQVVGDKTGYALAAAEYTALVNLIWDELTGEARTAGSYGQLLKDFLNAAITSRAAPGDAMDLIVDAVDSAALAASAANEIVDAWLDRAAAVEGFTPRELLRLFAAVLVGKASGLETTTAVYRDLADVKARITATVDADGNRTAVVRDAT